MTTISSLIQTLTTILANHGDFVVTTTNDVTGELRYIDGIDVSEDLGEINLTHVSFGEMFADDEDAEFFIAEVDASMTDEEFLQALTLLGLC